VFGYVLHVWHWRELAIRARCRVYGHSKAGKEEYCIEDSTRSRNADDATESVPRLQPSRASSVLPVWKVCFTFASTGLNFTHMYIELLYLEMNPITT